MTESVTAEIRAFIVDNFLFGQEGDGFSDEQSLLESRIVDSTGLLELVSFLEGRYGITIEDRELMPENLDSLQNLARFVARKQQSVGANG